MRPLRGLFIVAWAVLGALVLCAVGAAIAGVIKMGELVVALVAASIVWLGLLYNRRWLRRRTGDGGR